MLPLWVVEKVLIFSFYIFWCFSRLSLRVLSLSSALRLSRPIPPRTDDEEQQKQHKLTWCWSTSRLFAYNMKSEIWRKSSCGEQIKERMKKKQKIIVWWRNTMMMMEIETHTAHSVVESPKKSEFLFLASVGKYLRSDRISDDNLKHRDINFVYTLIFPLVWKAKDT